MHTPASTIPALLAALCSCVACAPTPDDEILPPAAVARVKLLEADIGLPPNSSSVFLVEDGWQLIRFDTSLAEARGFARRVLGRPAVRGDDPAITHLDTRWRWWTRDFPPGAEGGKLETMHRSANVVIVPDGSRATVWVAVSAR